MINENTLKVEIWSDVVCPFCYIGKRRFEEALAQFAGKNKVDVQWKSFLLDPSTATEPGKKIHQVLAEKKGWTIDYAKRMNQHVSKMANEVGLNYQFENVIPASSFDAHRLIQLATKYDLQDAAEEILFRAYFIEGKNIDDRNTLLDLGTQIGLNKAEIDSMLQSDAFADDVKADAYEAEQIGVRGVPFFVFNRKYAVSGAQATEVFAKALNSAWKELIEENPIQMTDDNSCDIDSNC